MVNLEKLDLQLDCERETFIDGNDLKTNIINYLLQLKTFTFNIMLTNYSNNQTNLPSNEDIQETFKDFKYNQVISCVDYFQDSRYSQCHVYSYPYKSIYYHKITNNFPGRLFECVRIVSLFDERPFEHEFFLRIQKSFPFMKKLDVTNYKAQKDKQCRKLENENENLSIIEYHHLTELCLTKVHEDYLEEFLLDTKTCLPNGICLLIDYRRLKEVTHNFERNATRINCSKINYFYNEDITDQLPKHFKDYFLHADVVRF
jgi:ferredoxin-like protein FixX